MLSSRFRLQLAPAPSPSLRQAAAGSTCAKDKASGMLELTRQRTEFVGSPLIDDVELIRVVNRPPGTQWIDLWKVGATLVEGEGEKPQSLVAKQKPWSHGVPQLAAELTTNHKRRPIRGRCCGGLNASVGATVPAAKKFTACPFRPGTPKPSLRLMPHAEYAGR